jgi:flagellin
MQMEIDALYAENDRLANSTQFNGINLLDGSIDGVTTFFIIQVGARGTPNDTLDISNVLQDATNVTGFGHTPGSVSVRTHADATNLITSLDGVLTDLNSRRGNIGAIVNRLEGIANNLMTSIENISASESRIRNTDIAAEAAELTRNQILQQSAATVLAQANQSPSLALQLLQ